MYVRIGRQGIFFRSFVPSRGRLEERPPRGAFRSRRLLPNQQKRHKRPREKKDTSDPKKKTQVTPLPHEIFGDWRCSTFSN